MAVKLNINWINSNTRPVIINLYKSLTRFDSNSLPSIFAEIPRGQNYYVDTEVEYNQTYYYMFSCEYGGSFWYSECFEVTEERELSTWVVLPDPEIKSDYIIYQGKKGEGDSALYSYAEYNLKTALVDSFKDEGMQQWQAVKDAVGQLTAESSWTFDNAAKVVYYKEHQEIEGYRILDPKTNQPTTSTIAQLCTSIIVSQYPNSVNLRNAQYSSYTLSGERAYCNVSLEIFDGYDWNSTTTQADTAINLYPHTATSELTITYQQVADKIIANSNAEDEGVSLLAQVYLQEVVKSILNEDLSKRFVNMGDLIPIFNENIYNFGISSLSGDLSDGVEINWESFGYPEYFKYYLSSTPMDINHLPEAKVKYISGTTNSYKDQDETYEVNYIRIGAMKNGKEILSDEVSIIKDKDWSLVDLLLLPEAFSLPSTDIRDYSSYKRNLTVRSDVKIIDGSSVGKDRVFFFDGDGDRISTTVSALGFDDFTYEAYVYPLSDSGGNSRIFQIGDLHGLNSFALIRWGNYLTVERNNGSWEWVLAKYEAWFVNNWYHVCLMRKDGILYALLNGQLVGEAYFNYEIVSGDIYIGQSQQQSTTTDAFHGYMEGFRLTKGSARYNITGFIPDYFPKG